MGASLEPSSWRWLAGLAAAIVTGPGAGYGIVVLLMRDFQLFRTSPREDGAVLLLLAALVAVVHLVLAPASWARPSDGRPTEFHRRALVLLLVQVVLAPLVGGLFAASSLVLDGLGPSGPTAVGVLGAVTLTLEPVLAAAVAMRVIERGHGCEGSSGTS